jgi:hypothetical protein
MIIVIGLIILIAAVLVGVAGVLGNGGSAHALTHGFSALGYHITGSTGTLFLSGIVVGAVGLFGLTLLLAGARRTSRRGGAARHRLQEARRETAAVSRDRDDLIEQRRTAGGGTSSTPEDRGLSAADDRQGRRHVFGHRSATRQAAPTPGWPGSQPGSDVPAQPGSDVPAETPVPAE